MNLFRAMFLVLGIAALGGVAYVGYYGLFRASSDLNTSIRVGSGGPGVIGRIK